MEKSGNHPMARWDSGMASPGKMTEKSSMGHEAKRSGDIPAAIFPTANAFQKIPV
jgi:hypothetical protein